MQRFFRCLVCVLVVCCLLVNLSPIKANATSGVLPAIASAAGVTVSAPVAIAAGLIALGIMAGTNDDFQRVVSNAVADLGDWVKDGTVELIQTVDSAGKKAYYMASDLMEDLRSFAFSSSVLVSNGSVREFIPAGSTFNNWPISYDSVALKYITYSSYSDTKYLVNYCYDLFNLKPDYKYVGGYKSGACVSFDGHDYYYRSVESDYGYVLKENLHEYISSNYPGVALMHENASVSDVFAGYGFSAFSTDYNLLLGQVSSVPVDGTSAREWSEEYTNRGLYVVEGSGGSSTPPEGDSGDDGNENNGKWYWPLVLGAAAFGAGAGVGALTQQDQWTGDTPEDFNDYTTGTEYEIVGAPEVEFGTGIELVVPDPAPDSGGDSSDNPGAGTDPDEDPDAGAGGSNDYSSWLSKILALLEKIWNSILEIPTKFTTWFDNIISEIQELPSKFATWFENIISAIQELPSKFADWFGNLASKLENIWEAICNIPEAIGNVLRSIFVPSEDFLTEKVQDLRNRFNWIEPILGYGNYIKAQLVNPEPPVLYVHLGNAEGSYNYGGTVKFLDLTWYERYKSQGDAIISGFLWALFAWRMYVKLPGIINGVAGDVGHISYGESAWQKTEGRKERKEKGGKNK